MDENVLHGSQDLSETDELKIPLRPRWKWRARGVQRIQENGPNLRLKKRLLITEEGEVTGPKKSRLSLVDKEDSIEENTMAEADVQDKRRHLVVGNPRIVHDPLELELLRAWEPSDSS